MIGGAGANNNNIHAKTESTGDELTLILKKLQKALETKSPELSAKEISDIKKSFDVFYLAQLTLVDEERSLEDQREETLKLLNFSALIFLIDALYMARDQEEKHSYLTYGIAIITSILFIMSSYILYQLQRKILIDSRLNEAKNLLMSKQHTFENEEGNLVLFKNPRDNTKFMYNMSKKNFLIQRKPGENKKIEYPKYNMDHSCVALYNRSVNLLYMAPDQNALHGTFAGIKILEDGHTDFSGNLIYISSGEVISVPEYENSPIRKLFAESLPTIALKINKAMEHEQVFWSELYFKLKVPVGDQQIKATTRNNEETIVRALNTAVVELFRESKYPTDCKIRDEDYYLNTLKNIEIFSFMQGGQGVCRHRSIVLAKLLQYAKEMDLLEGKLRIRMTNGNEKLGGHMWLEYHPKYKKDEADYYFVDPMNDIFSHKSEIRYLKDTYDFVTQLENQETSKVFPKFRN